jgi:hypothetical protein
LLVLNMENHLRTSRYRFLQDMERFHSVKADGERLIFGDALRIEEDELVYLVLSVPTAEENENE